MSSTMTLPFGDNCNEDEQVGNCAMLVYQMAQKI